MMIQNRGIVISDIGVEGIEKITTSEHEVVLVFLDRSANTLSKGEARRLRDALYGVPVVIDMTIRNGEIRLERR
jgi:hypothetical protein